MASTRKRSGIDHEQIRTKRSDVSIQVRKEKRDAYLRKMRFGGAAHVDVEAMPQDLERLYAYVSTPERAAEVASHADAMQAALHSVEVGDEHLRTSLDLLSNLASHGMEQFVYDTGALPHIVEHLLCGQETSADVRQSCVYVVGNIAGHSREIRQVCCRHGALQGIVAYYKTVTNRMDECALCVWAANNVQHGRTCRDAGVLQPLMQMSLAVLTLATTYDDADTVKTVLQLMTGTTSADAGIAEQLWLQVGTHDFMTLLDRYDAAECRTAVLDILSDYAALEDPRPTQQVLECGAVQRLVLPILQAPTSPAVRANAFWFLSNVAAGTTEQNQYLRNIPELHAAADAAIVEGPTERVKNEAMWFLNNLDTCGPDGTYHPSRDTLGHVLQCMQASGNEAKRTELCLKFAYRAARRNARHVLEVAEESRTFDTVSHLMEHPVQRVYVAATLLYNELEHAGEADEYDSDMVT